MQHFLTYAFIILFSFNASSQGINSPLFSFPTGQVSLPLQQQETYDRLDSQGLTYLVNLNDISAIGGDGIIDIVNPNQQNSTYSFEVKNAHKDANDNLYWYGTLPVSSDTTNDLTGYLMYNDYNGRKFGVLSIDTLTFHLFDLGNNINLLVKFESISTDSLLQCGADMAANANSLINEEIELLSTRKHENNVVTRSTACNEVNVLILTTSNASAELGGKTL
jgi:hypothetical protein